MFDYIVGKITIKKGLSFTLENNDIGYNVYAPFFVLQSFEENDNVKIYLYQNINETTNDLYGFLNEFDRDFFILLISISGVGAKLALKILSSIIPSDLSRYILGEDIENLKKVKGLGNKTAAQMILELKPKLEKADNFSHSPVTNQQSAMPFRQQLEDALVLLGYKNKEIERIVKTLYKNHTPTSLEEAIKLALKSEDH